MKNGDNFSFLTKQKTEQDEFEIGNEKQIEDKINNQQNQEEKETEKLFEGFQFKSRKSFLIQQFEDILKRQRGIVLGIKFFFNKLFCGLLFQSEENEMIEKASDLIARDLDIYVILSKLQEIEKIKRVIFDNQQIVLFNFFPKPEIGEDNDETKCKQRF